MKKKIPPFWPIIVFAAISVGYITLMFVLLQTNVLPKSFETVMFAFTLPTCALVIILAGYAIFRTCRIIKNTKEE